MIFVPSAFGLFALIVSLPRFGF